MEKKRKELRRRKEIEQREGGNKRDRKGRKPSYAVSRKILKTSEATQGSILHHS